MAKADVTARAKGSLRALNFFMADMQSGIGPFVGVFLLAHGCGLSVLLTCRPLLALGATLAIFSLGNGAMLSIYALAVVDAKQADPAAFVAATVVIAQVTMVFASLLAMRFIGQRGYWPVILVSIVVLPIRAVIAPYMIKSWGVWPMQVLDGITSGLQTVAVPGLVARILNGTGRINAGQGAVLTIQGAGAALSPAIAGWVAQWRGYDTAFWVLGACGVISIALWISSASIFTPSRARAKMMRARTGKLSQSSVSSVNAR